MAHPARKTSNDPHPAVLAGLLVFTLPYVGCEMLGAFRKT
jgi:hypothetical protein